MIPIELGFMRHDIENIQQGQELVDWAMDHNVNHFEQCSFYLNWQCEDYLYSLLKKYQRKDYSIIGKMPIYNVIQHRDLKALFFEQLEKVPEHYFDIYLLQAVDEKTFFDIHNEQLIPFLLEQKEQGKIRRLGISIQCLPEIFQKYLDICNWDIVQMPINYYDWYLCRYNENYDLAIKYGIPIIAQAPLKGKFLIQNHCIPANSFNEYNRTNLQAAYDFVTNLQGIEMILCGNSKLKTFKETYEIISQPFYIPGDKYEKVISDYIKYKAPIQCLYCIRCTKACPKKLPLTSLFKLYNLALTNKEYFNAFTYLKDSLPVSLNEYCNKCGKCINVCPLDNNIPFLLNNKITRLRV